MINNTKLLLKITYTIAVQPIRQYSLRIYKSFTANNDGRLSHERNTPTANLATKKNDSKSNIDPNANPKFCHPFVCRPNDRTPITIRSPGNYRDNG